MGADTEVHRQTLGRTLGILQKRVKKGYRRQRSQGHHRKWPTEPNLGLQGLIETDQTIREPTWVICL